MSDFLVRKLKTFFKHSDLDNDGYISLKDVVGMAERHCHAEKVDDAEREKVKACFAKVRRSWMKSTESDDNGLLTASIFVESVKQQRNDPEFKDAFRAMCEQFFRVLDVNGDGFLQEDEYTRSVLNTGIKDASLVRRAFESIDLNKDALRQKMRKAHTLDCGDLSLNDYYQHFVLRFATRFLYIVVEVEDVRFMCSLISLRAM